MDLYVWIIVGLPFLGAVAEYSIRHAAPDFTGPQNYRFWVYFFAYLLLCFFDARQIKRKGIGQEIALFSLIWLVPAYLWQRSRATKSRPGFLVAWVAAWRLSLLVFPPEVVNGVYAAGGIPECNSSTSRGEIEAIFNRRIAEQKSNIAVVATRGFSEISSTGKVRTCRARIELSNKQEVDTVFTIAKYEKRIEYKLLIGSRSET